MYSDKISFCYLTSGSRQEVLILAFDNEEDLLGLVGSA
ncbi:hypothetical protein X474_04860 [Dethiosulfatarculus sandiegensis]|uniref:Uncharacterized protein n=1 Tax=Dethiosulfatarculus sandiegensis TaxID=1429043 RepID=A0A0D2JHI6_9BACT|nr:hypothetical protein X474_04860 [Dethiosulfatarculus sandiegensis]